MLKFEQKITTRLQEGRNWTTTKKNAIYDPWASHFTKMWFRGLVTQQMTRKYIHSDDDRLLRTLCIVHCAIKHRQHDSNQLPTPQHSAAMKTLKKIDK